MTEKEIVNDMKKMLEEMKNSKGLPPNFATEAQLWDEIMKREAWNMPQQLFPLIKEIHGKDYPEGTTVRPLATEFSVERGDTKEIASVRADITVLIGERDIYHFECEIKYDGTIVMRMFEYDIHIGISYQKLEEHPHMQFSFPHSAVIYLQPNDNIPDQLSCSLRFPDGSVHDYTVPTMKVQNYSLEEIRQKHLCILIPFLPLRFRKFFNSRKNMFELKKEELTSFYRQLILILEEEVEAGFLSEKNRSVIINLLVKSMIRVFYKDEVLYKEVVDLMEPILELEIDKYINALDEAIEKYELVAGKVQETEEKLKETEGKVREAESKVQEAESKVQEAESKVQDITNRYEKNVNELKDQMNEKDKQIQELQKQLQTLQKRSN